jgi:NhaP-type Na+/H+ or K+/H+ antiporter
VVGITLALLLFAEASTLNVRHVMAEVNLEARLISICVLGSIGIGGAIAWLLFPGEEIAVVLLIGAALAPTDAALSVPFNANPTTPGRIRHALHVESGLSDGVVAPVIALLVPLAIAESVRVDQRWLTGELKNIVFAVAIGAIAGGVGGWMIREALARAWTTPQMGQLAFMALAVGTFFSSGNWDGNRYIAAFVGGLIAGAVLREEAHETAIYVEESGTALSFLVWVIFGAVLAPLAVGSLFTWQSVAFAMLALTFMRLIPVAVSLAGFGMRGDTLALMGWFGPRGLPSIAFLVTALIALQAAGVSTETFVGAMTWTILLSVVAHGVSARPLGRWYAHRLASAPRTIPEFELDDIHTTGH